ncbi:MAG TPA: hypothetical protein VMZ27_13195, partial [Candidatus Saccharimonadales bacterium]|nr:hypothetical protein [Candidatus Saccharimonadales bacterium]
SAALEKGDPVLKPMAKHPNAQRVVTAYVISGGYAKPDIDVDSAAKEQVLQFLGKYPYTARAQNWHTLKRPVKLWLDAVESAGVKDLESAEQLALASYQAGELKMAARWIRLSRPDSVTAQWLQAKLLLHDGQVDQAARLLARIVPLFPTNASNSKLEGSLVINSDNREHSVQDRARAELGALHLVRRDYVQALEALWLSGDDYDAAYVAECVLTIDELKNFADRHAPGAQFVRDLLSRRLARAKRYEEALTYCEGEQRTLLAEYVADLRTGRDPTQPRGLRAESLWHAAQLLNRKSPTFFKAEVGPDWHYAVVGKTDFQFIPSATNRLSLTNLVVLKASADEEARVSKNIPQPEKQQHPLYVALDLAWESVQLMPDNTDQTARALWDAGSWIKARDPQAADRFYKALVRRCAKTALGAEADKRRWFPRLDDKGNIIPVPPKGVSTAGTSASL